MGHRSNFKRYVVTFNPDKGKKLTAVVYAWSVPGAILRATKEFRKTADPKNTKVNIIGVQEDRA